MNYVHLDNDITLRTNKAGEYIVGSVEIDGFDKIICGAGYNPVHMLDELIGALEHHRDVAAVTDVAGAIAEVGLLHKVGSTYEMETCLNPQGPYIWRCIFDGRPDHMSTEGIELINPLVDVLIVKISR